MPGARRQANPTARQSLAAVGRTRSAGKLHYLNAVPIYEIQRRWIRKFEEPRLTALAAIKQRAENSQ